MEAEEAGSTGLVMLVSWPCIGCRTSLPSVVKSNVAFLDTGGSSRLAVHTIVFSATPARKIPTAYPLPCWWNPKAYRPEGDSQDKFEPDPFFKNSFILRKARVHGHSTTNDLQQHNSKAVNICFDCHWQIAVPFRRNITPCSSDSGEGSRLIWF
ncbi:hypothetical protein RJ640_020557 [Escallonia rubra]|uniref:Uncharacterized protein n=1 Tax=Escallonia rubra TaxID=112253 RepID=A0AA88QDL0_9ASTE|nr:hypothetical protein RJ640_020557 [Escallonia rubra]